jgi:hypothetical protein
MGTASMIERMGWERKEDACLISDSQIAFILQLCVALIVTARSSPLAKRYSRKQLNGCGGWDSNPRIPKKQGSRNQSIIHPPGSF